jgi:5-methyltetrahydrofolate--homocysteine methyltransferase
MDIQGKEWRKGRVLLADGAWGTEFFKRGLMQGSPPDEWNLLHPEIVEDITREYLEAGAEVILTNTFGANRLRLESHGLAGKSKDINETGARLARGVAGRRAIVAGDIGPCGKLFALGEVGSEELYAAFAEQAAGLREGGADWIVVESMTDMEEMAIAVKAARESAGIPVVASMTYNKTPKGFRTMMGNTPEACVEKAQTAGASVIGANCGSGIEDYVPLAPVLRGLTKLPLWIKANAGIPGIVGGKVVYPLDPQQYASYVPALVEAGVDAIGGCCGTDPRFIREIGRQLSKMGKK